MRDEVRAFAQAMETRMAEFDEKKGEDSWKQLDFLDAPPLLARLQEKTQSLVAAQNELFLAAGRKVPRTDLEPIRKKILQVAADVGNYAMLVADVTGALPDSE